MKKNRKGFSLIELLIVIVVTVIVIAIAVPNAMGSLRTEYNEASAIQTLRSIVRAQSVYQTTSQYGFFASNITVLVNAGLLDNDFDCAYSRCVKNGYSFQTYPIARSATTPPFFDAAAVPLTAYGSSATGTRSFYANESGAMYFNMGGVSPTASSSVRVVNGSLLNIYNIFPNKFDFDADGKSDLVTYRPSDTVFYFQSSGYLYGYGGPATLKFGEANDKFVPADYDGDGRTNIAAYRDGTWYIRYGRYFEYMQSIQFGEPTDIPVPADYDGDGKADIAVFRPDNGVWYLRQTNGGFTAIALGQNGDKPVAGDFDGDGKADLAVFRPSEGIWYIQQSTAGFKAIQFGVADDKLVAADYDGDGRMDVAVYRPSDGTWYLNQSAAGLKSFKFGISTDLPVPADYNGDTRADIAVFRDGTWFIQQSGIEQLRIVQFGASGDLPVANAFVR